ncbi:MAG TPA: hypothetical protein VFB14_26445 [Bryobacteraceae bacterium]|jgi:hypothetical protein|nr:hypothetical protein [Bryobacteraceae bacterium]
MMEFTDHTGMCRYLICVILSGLPLFAASFPEADISNGVVHAKILLPDPDHGYYRGTRFDWAGVIESLTYASHDFFGKWFEHYDPHLHDAIMGPVEEFRSEDGALGYAEAKPGGTFVKIGVGVLRKPDDRPYVFARTYELIGTGKRVVRPGRDRVEFVQTLSDGEGYAYEYRKTVRLAPGKPELILEHTLKNTGKRVIETSVYDHDFYVIDGQPTGPDFVVKFAFAPHATDSFQGLAEIRGNDLVYLKELQPRRSVAGYLEGFSDKPADNDIRVENTKVRAGVRETGDRPISKFYFWSIRTTVCPEAYIHMRIEPHKQFKWGIKYDFYTLK